MHDPDAPVPSLTHPPLRSSPKYRTVLAWGLMLALGAVVAYLVRTPTSAAAGAGPGSVGTALTSTVTVAPVTRRDVPLWLDALGTVTSPSTVVVRPQVSGVLTGVNFTEGQTVRAGDVLATLDPRPFNNALLQAEGVRRRDEAQLAHARATLSRFQALLQQNAMTRQDVDTQAALVQQLEGTVATDVAAERTARLNLSYTRITAPVAGRVGLRRVDAGNTLANNDAAGITVITQVQPMGVVFGVPQDQVPELAERARAGTLPVEVWDRGRSTRLDLGHFVTLDNQIDTTTGTVKAKATFDNAQHNLFPNQFVNVRLQLRTLPQALVVPVTAVRQGAHGSFVYVLNDRNNDGNNDGNNDSNNGNNGNSHHGNKLSVRLQAVSTMPASATEVVVTEGLREGQRVVTEGADRLKDGATVRLPDTAPPAAPPALAGHAR